MNQYKMEIFSDIADDGTTYWTVRFPAVPNCVGGGDTPEEAIEEAQENLAAHLEYLSGEGYPIPESDLINQEYSGKIALRVAKSTHRKLAERAKEEGISTNTLIGNAIEFYFGNQNYDDRLNAKIDKLQNTSSMSLVIQRRTEKTVDDIWAETCKKSDDWEEVV